jgi:hypothetical protein
MERSFRLMLSCGLALSAPAMFLPQQANAQGSCEADFTWSTSALNPLEVQFNFTGYCPPGSFSFLGAWDFGDGGTSGDSLPVHTFDAPGHYTVCLSFDVCIGGGISCHDDTCITLFLSPTAGIGEQNGPGDLLIGPSPVKDELQISLSQAPAGSIQARVFDALGRLVINRSFPGAGGSGLLMIPTSALSTGEYVLHLQGDGWARSRKIQVQ